jgi:hypothetical protein
MAKSAEGNEFSLLHLSFGILHESTLLGGEDVIGINQPFGLYEYTVVFSGERYKISLTHLEFFENVSGNDNLTPLAYAPDRFPCGCGGLACHSFRLSDCQKLSSGP